MRKLLERGDPDGSRPIAGEAVERPVAPDVPDRGVGSLGLLTLVEAEQGLRETRVGGLLHQSASHGGDS